MDPRFVRARLEKKVRPVNSDELRVGPHLMDEGAASSADEPIASAPRTTQRRAPSVLGAGVAAPIPRAPDNS